MNRLVQYQGHNISINVSLQDGLPVCTYAIDDWPIVTVSGSREIAWNDLCDDALVMAKAVIDKHLGKPAPR
jgi:hypothetical protein